MSEPKNPTLLTEVLTEADAILLCDALAEHGIRAVYNGAAIAGFRAEAPAMVRVLVASDDLEPARRVLTDRGIEAAEVDWASVDVGEAEDADREESPDKGFEVALMSWFRGVIPMLVILFFLLMIL